MALALAQDGKAPIKSESTQSGIKTRSSLGGSPENFNEICFEDKKGEELLYIRAEKDQTIAVENIEAAEAVEAVVAPSMRPRR